jgi:fatty acid elongase 3
MYWYYFQSARGVKIWWKEWITRLQITQFVIDLGMFGVACTKQRERKTSNQSLGFVYFASYTYFTSTYFRWMPSAGECAGEEFAAFAGIGTLTSYLVLFISFYFATYKKDKKAPNTRKTLRRMSQAPLPDPHVIASTSGNGQVMTTGSKRANGTMTRSRKA